MSNKPTPFIRFLGGKNAIFALIFFILLCVSVLLFNMISFLFAPVNVLISSIISPLLLAVIFYYLFSPLVKWLEKHKVPRQVGASLSLFLLIAVFLGSIMIIIPLITEQILSFARIFPSLVTNFVSLIENYSRTSEFQAYFSQALSWINSSLKEITERAITTIGSTIQGVSSIVSTLSGVFFTILTFPMFLFFLLIDGKQFKNGFLKLFPPHIRQDFNQISHDVNQQVGAYIKGRLIVSFCIGVYFFVIFTFINLSYAFVLSLLLAIASLIPYIGSIIALVPCIIVALIQSPFTVLQVVIIWAIAQILDGNVLGPMIIGKNLKMHPMTIIIVLIVTGNLYGIVGMIIGIPLYAIIRIFAIYAFKRYSARYNRYFGQENGHY